MPFKANAARRHHIPKQRRRITNWAEYDAALRQRGSLTVWFTEEAIAAWHAEPRTTPGGQPHYSDLAITTALTLKAVFRLALRQTEGLIGSLMHLLDLGLPVPDHTTLSRRAATLEVPRPRSGSRSDYGHDTEPVHLLVDSTGLKLCGPGEWLIEKHGTKTRRSWRKLHLGVDANTGQIVATVLTSHDADDGAQVGPLLDQVAGPVVSFTGDGAYDQDGVYASVAERHSEAEVVVPPRATAVLSQTAERAATQRDRHLQHIADHGRMAWQKVSGYTKRARAEAAIGRWKRVTGDRLRAHTDERRAPEALCCTGRGRGRTGPSPVLGSCDADGLRASQLQHAVERVDADVDLGHAAPVGARVQPVPDHALVPRDGRLGPGAGVVARRLLPSHAPLLGDELEVAVPLRRRSLGRLARYRRRARRDDDLRLGVALGHVGVNALLVVRAVRREGGDRVRDLVEQGADLGGVVLAAVGQRGRHDPAGPGVHAQVHLAPGAAPLRAVLLHQPLARAVELQPRAVDQQVQGLGTAAGVVAVARPRAARLRPRHLQRLGPAAQGGVVRHGEVEPEQADDGADQPFGLPVRQPEHGLERQRRQDRQVGILGLPAPARAPLGLPRLDRLVRKPDRHAATPAQALVVIAPVRDLALLLRDVVASVLVQLEGQGGHPGSDGGPPCYLDRAPGATRGIPATT